MMKTRCDVNINKCVCDKNVTMVQLKVYSNGTQILNSLVGSHVPLTLMKEEIQVEMKSSHSIFIIRVA